MDSVYVMDIQLAGMHGYKATPFAYLALMFSVCSFKLSCHWCPPLVPSIAHGAYLCQAVLREAGKNSTRRLPGNGVGDAKHTPGVGAGGNPVRIRTCVFLTVPAPRSPLVLWGYYWGNISHGIRLAFALQSKAFAMHSPRPFDCQLLPRLSTT